MRTPASLGSAGQDELWLQTACAGWLVAMSSQHVDRLILPEEGLLAPDPFPGPPASLGMLTTRARAYSAWDLGLLLGLAPQAQAYVLVELQGVPLALRTGACLGLAPLPATGRSRLPERLASARPGALAFVFPAAAGRLQASLGSVGIGLDVERLLTAEELLHADAACLAASMVRMEAQEAQP